MLPWLDRTALLDHWTSRLGEVFRLFGLSEPLAGHGYLIERVDTNGSTHWMLAYHDGHDLVVVPPPAAVRRLRRMRREVRRGRSAALTAGAAGLLVLMSACASGPAGKASETWESMEMPTTAEPAAETTTEPVVSAECPILAPVELPDGSPPGDYVEADVGVSWGRQDNRVVQAAGKTALEATGEDGFDTAKWLAAQTVTVDGVDRFVIPVGDYGVSEVQIRFIVAGCPYINFLAAGTSETDAMDFAGRF